MPAAEVGDWPPHAGIREGKIQAEDRRQGHPARHTLPPRRSDPGAGADQHPGRPLVAVAEAGPPVGDILALERVLIVHRQRAGELVRQSP
jgi:hypothetical protein